MATRGRGRADYYAHGDYNMVCSMCGRKRKASYLIRNWEGLYRCPEHDEIRQPQDFARGIKDDMTVPFAQKPIDKQVAVCKFNDCSAVPGYSVPGCSVPGRTVLLHDNSLNPMGWTADTTMVTADSTTVTMDVSPIYPYSAGGP